MGKPRFDEKWLEESVSIYKNFTYDGKPGQIDRFNYVTWGGMGFHLDAACPGLKLAALNAK